jgi:hypothetical protein
LKLQRASPSETELATDRRSLMKSACLLRVSIKHREIQPWRPHIPKANELLIGEARLALDSPLERNGFEPSVPYHATEP